tara:strand:- start:388 stop:852 length:465 start_codon:yes stop_codon:yes gene_type:complete
MIKEQSKQTYFLLQQEVLMDITKKGWVAIETPPETSYDIVVDMGLIDGKREFVTIQVKKDLRTTSRPSSGKNEPVSTNGKNRNSYSYYDEDITYLASLNKYGDVEYIHKKDYKYKTPAQLKKSNRSNFPINHNMTSYRKAQQIDNIVTLESFID